MNSAGRGGGGLPTVPRTGCPSLTLGQVRAIIELHQGVFFISGASGQSLILARTGEPGADNPRFLFVPCIRRAGRLHSHTIGTDPVLIEKWRSFREQHFGLRAAAAGDGATNNDGADPAAVAPAPSAMHGGPRRRVGHESCRVSPAALSRTYPAPRAMRHEQHATPGIGSTCPRQYPMWLNQTALLPAVPPQKKYCTYYTIL